MSFGLVLSGGAALGMSGGGVLDILEREGLRPDCIAGSSMGAIIGGLYAMGLHPDALHSLAQGLRMRNIARWSDTAFHANLHSGFFRQRLEDHLHKLVGDACVGDCRIPFVCVAGRIKEMITWRKIITRGFVDHITGRVDLAVFPRETRLIDAMMASSAIPVVFSPVEIKGESYIDLCHFGAIPARTLRAECRPDHLIACDAHPSYRAMRAFLPPSWDAFLQEGYGELDRSRAACDLLIKPKAPAALYRFDRADAFWKAGREAAEERLSEVRTLIAS